MNSVAWCEWINEQQSIPLRPYCDARDRSTNGHITIYWHQDKGVHTGMACNNDHILYLLEMDEYEKEREKYYIFIGDWKRAKIPFQDW